MFKKAYAKVVAFFASLLMFVSLPAAAAVPVAVSDAITQAGTDGASVASLVLVAVVGIFAFILMRKGLR